MGPLSRRSPRPAVLTPEEALVELGRVLADEPDPHAALAEVCEIVRTHTRSDGAKVYLAVPHAAGPHGAALIPFHRTNISQKWRKALTVTDVGLSDWVYRHNDWLLIPQGVPAERTGVEPERAITGQHGVVQVFARKAADVLGLSKADNTDDEKSLLFVPMHRGDHISGVLAVWRNEDPEYDSVRDVAALMQLAPHAVSACVAALRLDVARKELTAMNDLAEQVHPATRLAEAYDAVLAAAARVAGAPAAVLFYNDPDRPGHLSAARTWAATSDLNPGLKRLFGGYHLNAGTEPMRWFTEIQNSIPQREVRADLVLRLQHLFPFPDEPHKGCAGAIGILSTPADAPTLLPSENAQPLKSLLQYTAHALRSHIAVHAASLVEEMDFSPRNDEGDLSGLLRLTAEQLMLATGSDAALVYMEDWDGWKLWAWSGPGVPPEVRMRLASASFRAIENKRVFRVSHANEGEEAEGLAPDIRDMRPALSALGFRGIQSWVCFRVVLGERRLGAIQLLTKVGAEILTSDHVELGKKFLERAGVEIERASRRLLLEDLNRLATDLASRSGDDLGVKMPEALRAWAHKFLRPGCEVAFVARLRGDRPLLSGSSDAIDKDLLASLEKLSSHLGRKEAMVRKGDDSLAIDEAYVAAPLLLAESTLEGHLFVFHPRRFRDGDLDVVREAAREMSVVLSGERYRHEFTLSAGLFRHALLGPVQGLTQAARMLAVTAAAAGAKDVERLRARIDEEAEIISLWRENQRLYVGGRVDARPRSQPLRPVVERCVDRYLAVFQGRNLVLSTAWKPRGPVVFPFDSDGIDLALSNLLDNARKYSFFGRPVTVGVTVKGSFVQLWVEDIGHAIPVGKELYQQGKRSNLNDPFRIIRGEGLGLAMVNAVVEAHGGNFSHTCDPDGQSSDPETAPWRVRFLIELPHNWKEARVKHG